jgi:hypothetical protein
MYCDFSNGIELIEFLNLLPKLNPHRNPSVEPDLDSPPGWNGTLPDIDTVFFQAIIAGSWHHRDPGEARIHIDYSGFVSFYDPTLSSLVSARYNVPRERHQLAGISPEDIKAKLQEISLVASRGPVGSGIDWRAITRVIIDRYGARLEQLNYTLQSEPFESERARAAAARSQILVMLSPYLTVDDFSDTGIDGRKTTTTWMAPIVHRCAHVFTSHIPSHLLTSQERLLRDSIEQTLHEICRQLGLIWLDAINIEGVDEKTATQSVLEWRRLVLGLMRWLDWYTWKLCKPGCAVGVSKYFWIYDKLLTSY